MAPSEHMTHVHHEYAWAQDSHRLRSGVVGGENQRDGVIDGQVLRHNAGCAIEPEQLPPLN